MNIISESYVLAALLRDKSAIVPILDLISPSDFQDVTNQLIAEAIWDAFEHKQPPNAAVMNGKLVGMVDADVLRRLAFSCTQAMIEQVEYNAFEIKKASFQEKVVRALEKQVTAARKEIENPDDFVV